MVGIVKATLNNPIKKRLRNNEWVENATEITVMLYCQYGISDYNKLLEMKSRGDKNFSEFQYTVIMWTNGKARGYKCRNRYVYEGEGHRTYSDDFTELADDINKWFINL